MRCVNAVRISKQRSLKVYYKAWFPYDRKDRQRRKDRTILGPAILAIIAAALKRGVSIKTQGLLVTKLCDPCVAGDPCDHMETRLSQESNSIKKRKFSLRTEKAIVAALHTVSVLHGKGY